MKRLDEMKKLDVVTILQFKPLEGDEFDTGYNGKIDLPIGKVINFNNFKNLEKRGDYVILEPNIHMQLTYHDEFSDSLYIYYVLQQRNKND